MSSKAESAFRKPTQPLVAKPEPMPDTSSGRNVVQEEDANVAAYKLLKAIMANHLPDREDKLEPVLVAVRDCLDVLQRCSNIKPMLHTFVSPLRRSLFRWRLVPWVYALMENYPCLLGMSREDIKSLEYVEILMATDCMEDGLPVTPEERALLSAYVAKRERNEDEERIQVDVVRATTLTPASVSVRASTPPAAPVHVSVPPTASIRAPTPPSTFFRAPTLPVWSTIRASTPPSPDSAFAIFASSSPNGSWHEVEVDMQQEQDNSGEAHEEDQLDAMLDDPEDVKPIVPLEQFFQTQIKGKDKDKSKAITKGKGHSRTNVVIDHDGRREVVEVKDLRTLARIDVERLRANEQEAYCYDRPQDMCQMCRKNDTVVACIFVRGWESCKRCHAYHTRCHDAAHSRLNGRGPRPKKRKASKGDNDEVPHASLSLRRRKF
ncbi:hypothetical protein NM688_g6210 [Phlebia brevispora]|uniref:Uncharacterized protein n=1 Tax=Phlebia brevispora TaxID=194682 RepID=A0ACC1SIP6_9APHY|nr:hypothetical protein NM688_g6210 [Phlebia brevispora]